MKGVELVKKAIRLEEVEQIPWVPFVGVHAAKLIGISAEEYLKSEKHIVAGVSRAIDKYQPDGIPVVFDLQVEAEVLGCKLNWLKDYPPAVVSHPLLEDISIDDLNVPAGSEGRIPLIMNAARRIRKEHPDLALYGLFTGPFTLALHLMGTDVFMRMLEDPDHILKLMEFTKKVSIMMAKEYINAGCDVIAMVDPMTSQIDPVSFETFVFPAASEIFEHIRKSGALGSFFVCGNAQQNIGVMCRCKPDNISIDENIPLDFVRDVALSNGISYGGNIKLTVSLLLGSRETAMRDALECMDTGGKRGFILAPGCDLAMDTPPDNLKAISRLVRDEALQSELRASKAPVHDVEKLDLANHWDESRVVVDIVTLDSSSCAPCYYMVNAVARATAGIEDRVVYKEYKIKETQGVQMMATLGVKKIPTIVMDGNVEFNSKTPSVSEIRTRISEYLEKKIQE
ncbi:MAG: thioredoxin family protein [Bacteroidales bacterium]|nr:thioredoxin family protein [Bacteroidales bacterium]